jgi:hypothetical protein
MKRTTRKSGTKVPVSVVQRDDHEGLLNCLGQQRELLVPLLELIASGKQTIQSVMNQAGRAVAELLLRLSAQAIAGDKRPGRHEGEVLWHSSQGAAPDRWCAPLA